MAATVTCPNRDCGKSYQVPDDYLGRRGRCKSCGSEFVFSVTNSPSDPSGEARPSDPPKSNSGSNSSTARVGRTTTPSRLGRFQILERVGTGGFGTVYRAQDPQLQRTVALKLLQSTGDDQRDQQRINRFLVEGRAGARLQHPYIVPVYDAGKDAETGQYYLAAAFITGAPLSAAIDGRPLELRRAATIVTRLARALEYAHGQGILHRDIKPDNVMLDEQDAPHLMDFGLARMEESESHLTRDGAVMGTPSYMSPEQCVGKLETLGPAADQYSLGCLFYELLTGEKLFDGPVSVQIHHQINTEAPAPSTKNSSVPKDLDTICLKTLSKEPGNRYASCAELAADLERWMSDEPIHARRLTGWERWNRWRRRNPAIARLSISIAALLLLVAVISTAGVVRLRILSNEALAAKDDAMAAKDQEQLRAAEANEARKAAEQTTLKLQREVYKQRIARAHQEWQVNQIRHADELLDDCSVALRGWEWRYCKRLCRQGLLTFNQHKGSVATAVFSPDGMFVASASNTGNVKLWDAKTATVKFSFDFPFPKRYRLRTQFMAFTPDGKQLAAACEDGVVRVWDTVSGKEVWKVDGQGEFVSSLAISPDGKRLAIGQASFSLYLTPVSIKIWDLSTKQTALTLTGQSKNVTGLAFSQSGAQIAAVDWTGKIQIWEAQTGTLQQTVQGQNGNVLCFAFSPDERTIATGCLDNTIRMWDVKAGKIVSTLVGNSGDVNSLSFSSDGKQLLSCSEDRSIRLWDVVTGAELRTLRGHYSDVMSVRFAPDNRRAVSASHDGTVKIWDTTADQQFTKCNFRGTSRIPDWVRTVSFSPDGGMLATGSSTAQLVRTADGTLVRPLSLGHPYGSAFSADGLQIAASGSRAVKIWSTVDGREIMTLPGDGYIHSVGFSPDGSHIASTFQKEVRITNIKTKELVRKYDRHQDKVICVAFSPDGQFVASLSDDGVVKMWNVSTGEDVFSKSGPLPPGAWNAGNVVGNDLAFSPKGQLAVGGGINGKQGVIELWDATTGETKRRMEGHAGIVDAVAFNGDGTRLISGATDGTINIWDPALGEEIFSLQDDGGIISVAFSRDGQRIATGGVGESAKIWDAGPP